jgi:type I restriction enzyme, S subunit
MSASPQAESFRRLAEVAKVLLGQSPDSRTYNDQGEGWPFLQGNAEFGERCPTHRLYCTAPNRLCEQGDILLSVRAPVGATNQADQTYAIGRGLAGIRFDEADRSYGWHALRHAVPQLDLLAQGSTFTAVSRKEIEELLVWFPESDSRPIIATILDTLERAIEQTEALLAKQQRIKTGLMQDLLTRGLDAQGHLRDPSTHRFKISPLGKVPQEWDTPCLMEHANVMGGKRLPSGHNYSDAETGCLYLRVTDFFGRTPASESMQRLEPATFAALQRYEIKEADLYISIAGSLGHTGVFRGFAGYRVILTENAARIRIRSGFDSDYLSAQMNGPLVQPQVDAEAGIGSGVPKLALYRIEGLRVPHPGETEQTEVVKRLRALNAPISETTRMLAKLRRLKSGLMHDLLTGRVPVAPLLAEAGSGNH